MQKKIYLEYLTTPSPQTVNLIEKTRITDKRSEAHTVAIFSLSTKSAGRIARFVLAFQPHSGLLARTATGCLIDGRFARLASKC